MGGVKLELMIRINTQVQACRKYFKVNDCYEMDYLHDAFIRVVERMGNNYEEIGKFDAWVRTVAVNSIKTGLKHDKVIDSHFCGFIDDCEFMSCKTGVCDIRRKIVIEILILALGTLSSDDYKMVIGRMNGKSCSKIADELGLNIKTIRKHLDKSYKKIKDFACREYYNRYNEYLEDTIF